MGLQNPMFMWQGVLKFFTFLMKPLAQSTAKSACGTATQLLKVYAMSEYGLRILIITLLPLNIPFKC